MSRPFLTLALARALSPMPGTPEAATELLRAAGFVATCFKVKHAAAHSLYFVTAGGQDYTIKVTNKS